jgi:hypothetical protein
MSKVAVTHHNIQIPDCFRFLFEPKRKKMISGGRASAKSHSCARALVIKALEKRRRIVCAREIQKSIKESVKELLEKIIRQAGLEARFRFLTDKIIGDNGSEFLFIGLKNMQANKSLEDIDICWVEEAQTVSRESWNVLVPTIRNLDSEVWATFNRLSEQDPVFVMYCKNPSDDTIYKHFTYRDNPYFNATLEAERQLCKLQQPEEYDHIWEGMPISQSGFKAMIPVELIQMAQARIVQWHEVSHWPKIMGVDTARFGDDANNFWLRQGYRAEFLKQLYKIDQMQLCGNMTSLIDEQGIDQAFVDITGGNGSGAVDRANQLGYGNKITGVNFASAPTTNQKLYLNKRAEMYGLTKEYLKNGGSLPDGEIGAQLRYELSSVQYSYDKQNRLYLESKEEVKKRIGKSPDYADAFVLTFAYPVEKNDYSCAGNQVKTDYDPYAD